MPSILSRPTTTIVSPPSSPKSKRNREYVSTSDRLNRGCTGRNTIGKAVKREIVLDHNDYYKSIMIRLDQMKKEERTRRNRLINIDYLHQASREQLCKTCVIGNIENERQAIIDVISNHLVKKMDLKTNKD